MIRKSLISSSLILFSLGNAVAIAQAEDNANEIITRCAAEQDPGQRIACLEAALQGETRPPAVEQAAGPAINANTNEQLNTASAAVPESSPAATEVASSGAEVPTATMVRPITVSDTCIIRAS